MGRRTRQAAILVGGRGARLGALAAQTPKPLMPIDQDRVFLDELLQNIARQGFDDILLLAGYMHEQVSARYHGKKILNAHMRVVIEDAPAGTAGALTLARDLLEDRFLLANGDTLFDANFRRLEMAMDRAPEAHAALALRRTADAGRYGSVELEGRRIALFREKDPKSVGASGLINAGVGLFRREILELIQTTPCSIETDVYPQLAAQGRLLGVEASGYFIDIGLPDTLAQARLDLPARRIRPALFLDRDGVLNEDAGYTHKAEDLRWIPGARETIAQANDMGIFVIVVSNQAGIARGLYGAEDVDRFHEAMQDELARAGAYIDAFYICPYHPDAFLEQWRHPNHPDRKPNPGMIQRALEQWPINLEASALIGDRESDIEAAQRSGMTGYIFREQDLREISLPIIKRMQNIAA